MMPVGIPYRITLHHEKPINRTFWFEAVFTSGWQSIRSLLVDHLIKHRIPYIYVLGRLWFQYNEAWCSYEYEAEGDRVKFYLLEYVQN